MNRNGLGNGGVMKSGVQNSQSFEYLKNQRNNEKEDSFLRKSGKFTNSVGRLFCTLQTRLRTQSNSRASKSPANDRQNFVREDTL
jgi:hypothetical protein